MNKLIETLLTNKVVEEKVCGILGACGYITPCTQFSDAKLTELGKSLSKVSTEVDKEFLKTYRNLWLDIHRSTPKPIEVNYLRYLAEFPDHTNDEILAATKLHLAKMQSPYCGNADNFFVVFEKGATKYRCATWVEVYRNRKNTPDPDESERIN